MLLFQTQGNFVHATLYLSEETQKAISYPVPKPGEVTCVTKLMTTCCELHLSTTGVSISVEDAPQ